MYDVGAQMRRSVLPAALPASDGLTASDVGDEEVDDVDDVEAGSSLI